MGVLQSIGNLSPESVVSILQSQSEAITMLAERGVIILLIVLAVVASLVKTGEVDILKSSPDSEEALDSTDSVV
jgi:hypothetical protein